MTKKDLSRLNNLPVRHHPLYQGQPTLDFGDGIDTTAITPEKEREAFLSKYQELVDPLIKYEKYFSASAKSTSHIFREIKVNFKKLVQEGSWTEKKYVEVLDDIFTNRATLSVFTLDAAGLRYDKGQLASQRSVRKRGTK